jgi:aminoglycoside 3-N-acetyltransferase I
MNIGIKKLDRTELHLFKELIFLFEDVFEMKDFKIPPDDHLQQLLSKDTFFVFVAQLNGEIVGGLTCYTWDQYYAVRQLVYIFDLAVKKELQRKGIGRMLIDAVNAYAKDTGAEEVFVQADEVDDYALDFYRSTGGTGEKVVHFTYPLNK